MSLHLLGFTLFCIIVGVQSRAGLKPCKTDDQPCLGELGNAMYTEFLTGVPSANIKPADPLHLELIEGKLPSLNYNYTNSVIKGFKDCKSHILDLDLPKSNLSFVFTCPRLVMTATYDINGKLPVLPIEGHGPCNISIKDYKFVINSEIKKKTENGITHLELQNMKINILSRGFAQYNLKNLFNGQSDLVNGIHNFTKDHWRDIAKECEGPLWVVVLNKFFTILNDYLKIVPTDEMFLS